MSLIKHKRVLFSLILALASNFVLFAYNNNAQQIHPVGSEVYEALTYLYFLDGRTMPSNTAPWSGDELNDMLSVFDYKVLSPTEKKLYDFVKNELNLREDDSYPSYSDNLTQADFDKIDQNVFGIVDYDDVIINGKTKSEDLKLSIVDYTVGSLKPIEEEIRKRIPRPKIFQFGLDVALELYFHSNTDEKDTTSGDGGYFIGRENWNYHFTKHKPFVNVSFEVWPGDNFYIYFGIPFGNYMFHTDKSLFGESYLMTNIPLLLNLFRPSPADLDLNAPYRAFIAAGGRHWSLQIGRDKMSWGPGVVSNFVVGDNLLYHNMLRFATYYNSFKYTFALSFFPHPKLYSSNETGNKWGFSKNGQDTPLDGINMFMAHRLEWRFWKDKFKVVITEAIMYQSATNFIDLQILNPIMFFHDLYIRGNSNSIMSFEIEYTPIKSLNLYFQMVVDEIAMGAEGKPGKADKANPNAMGFMLGAKFAKAMSGGILHSSIEWAYTDPYLYLRDNGSGEQNEGDYGINYVVAIRQLTPSSYYPDIGERKSGTIYYDEQFLGYRYGGDAITLNLNLGYKRYKEWSHEFNFFYMAHGTHDMWTLWKQVTPTTNVTTPTDKEYSGNQKGGSDYKNAVAHYIVIGVSESFNLLQDLVLHLQLDFVTIVNAGNHKGNHAFDTQITAGITYSI